MNEVISRLQKATLPKVAAAAAAFYTAELFLASEHHDDENWAPDVILHGMTSTTPASGSTNALSDVSYTGNPLLYHSWSSIAANNGSADFPALALSLANATPTMVHLAEPPAKTADDARDRDSRLAHAAKRDHGPP